MLVKVFRRVLDHYAVAASAPARYLTAVALVVTALAVRFWIAPPEAGLQFVTFFPAVALTAILAGLGPGLLATAVGAIFAASFFLPTLGSDRYSVLVLGVFVADGVLVCVAIEAMHQYARSYQRTIAELEEAKRHAQEMQRKAEEASYSKSKFLANVSHELRTPLNAIIGFSDMILTKPFGPIHDKYAEYLADIGTSGGHLLGLINDLLDLAAIEEGNLALREETFAFVETLEECVRQMQPRAKEGRVSLAVELSPIPPVLADQRRIRQIVLNLLSNAVKFTPETGNVHVGASWDAVEGVTVTVTDTGIGMDEETVTKATQPFALARANLHRNRDSVGLGLSITKSLVELHGGTLKIESRLGKGTTVRVALPATRVVSVAA